MFREKLIYAAVAELADAQDSGSCGQYARGGSSPFCRTNILKRLANSPRVSFANGLKIIQRLKSRRVNIEST